MLLRNIDTLLATTGQSYPGRPGPAQEALLVITGRLRVAGWRPGTFGPGTLLGAHALCHGRAGYLRASAEEPSRIGFISSTQYRALYDGSPLFRRLADTSATDQETAEADGPPLADRLPPDRVAELLSQAGPVVHARLTGLPAQTEKVQQAG